MTASRKTRKTTTQKVAPEFQQTRDFISRFVALDDEQLDVATVWAMGTWTFSPASPAMPYTYPYLYVTGPSGSGKTMLGNQVFGSICRNHEAIAGATGAAMFRMLGDYDDETGEVVANFPTLAVDEIDATYNGAKDESQRQVFNIGYKVGTTVPRAAGKTTIRFPVYCPKILMGIDNGHLPETVANRSIRIDTHVATQDEVQKLDAFFPWNVDEDAAELQERLAQWGKDHAMVLRDYDPDAGSLSNRQWEISRSLVQLAKAAGVEKRIREALTALFTRSTTRPPAKVRMYKAIFDLFDRTGLDKVTTRQVMDTLRDAGIAVTGNSGKGLASMLSDEAISPTYLRIDHRQKDHPAYVEGKVTHRGYYRHYFDDAFVKYLRPDEDED